MSSFAHQRNSSTSLIPIRIPCTLRHLHTVFATLQRHPSYHQMHIRLLQPSTMTLHFAFCHHPHLLTATPTHDSHRRQEWSFHSTDTRHAGSDGSVNMVTGERASAYCVHTGSVTITHWHRKVPRFGIQHIFLLRT